MKTLKEIYKPPAPTPAQLLAWTETLKFNVATTLDLPTGRVSFLRDAVGFLSVTSPRGLMARVRLKEPGPVLSWSCPVAPVPCEPVAEGAIGDAQVEQVKGVIDHCRAECAESLRQAEWQAIVDSRKAVKTEVSKLRRKAKILGKKDGAELRERAKALARFVSVIGVSGFRLDVYPERGCWHIIEFHTGQGFACPSTLSRAFPGNKRGLMLAIRNAAAKRIAEVGPAELLRILDQFPVVNYPGELPAGAKEMGLVS